MENYRFKKAGLLSDCAMGVRCCSVCAMMADVGWRPRSPFGSFSVETETSAAGLNTLRP